MMDFKRVDNDAAVNCYSRPALDTNYITAFNWTGFVDGAVAILPDTGRMRAVAHYFVRVGFGSNFEINLLCCPYDFSFLDPCSC